MCLDRLLVGSSVYMRKGPYIAWVRRHAEAKGRCFTFDYGADGFVVGECWLKWANRTSAGSAFRTHRLFDYYERQQARQERTFLSLDVRAVACVRSQKLSEPMYYCRAE